MGRPDAQLTDNCAYCAHRPKAASGSPEANPAHPKNYLYGTGSGSHSPHGCMRWKVFLAFGGDTAVNPKYAPYFKKMLMTGRGQRN